MGQNHIGACPFPRKSRSCAQQGFQLIADGRDKWGLGFLIHRRSHRGKRSAGA